MNWNYFIILLTLAACFIGLAVGLSNMIKAAQEPAPEIPTGPAALSGEWPLHVLPPGEAAPICSRDYLLQVAAGFVHPFTAKQVAAMTLGIPEADISHVQAMVAATLLRGAGYRRNIVHPTKERRGGVYFSRADRHHPQEALQ